MDVTYDLSGFFGELIGAKARADAELLERAVEGALQGGQYGVLALHCDDGTLVAHEHPAVPYGEIHHAPSTASSDQGRLDAFTTWPGH